VKTLRKKRRTQNTIIAILLGTILGYLLAGPLTYNRQIQELQNRLDELGDTGIITLTGALSIAGSSTVLPITQEIANNFMFIHNLVQISVAGGGSGHGIKAAGSGEVDIGEASRNIKDTEFLSYPNLVAFAIGKDSVAIIINPENPLAGSLDLTMEQLAQLFSGEISNWNELGGDNHDIEIYTREAGSGTREVFTNYVLDPYEKIISGDASVKPSNGEMRASVTNNKYGIAYVSLGYVDISVSSITIDDIEASIENVQTGDYPITRILWVFTNRMPNTLEKAFIEYLQSSEGQAVVEDLGYIPIV